MQNRKKTRITWPLPLAPQHFTVPPIRRAQECTCRHHVRPHSRASITIKKCETKSHPKSSRIHNNSGTANSRTSPRAIDCTMPPKFMTSTGVCLAFCVPSPSCDKTKRPELNRRQRTLKVEYDAKQKKDAHHLAVAIGSPALNRPANQKGARMYLPSSRQTTLARIHHNQEV